MCEIYETKQIKRMLDSYVEKITLSDIKLMVDTRQLSKILPNFIYLQRNDELFKRMDIGKINFANCYIAFENYFIVCQADAIKDVVKSITREMIRCSDGLEFSCSICGMVYDCFPDTNMIKSHIGAEHHTN